MAEHTNNPVMVNLAFAKGVGVAGNEPLSRMAASLVLDSGNDLSPQHFPDLVFEVSFSVMIGNGTRSVEKKRLRLSHTRVLKPNPARYTTLTPGTLRANLLNLKEGLHIWSNGIWFPL
jgi:hypothetical protein